MPNSRFSPTALGALRLAQENATRLGHCYVGSEHLLLALASQEYTPAAQLLRDQGVDRTALRCSIAQLMGIGTPSPTLHQGLTPKCCRVIRRAVEECGRLGQTVINDRHLPTLSDCGQLAGQSRLLSPGHPPPRGGKALHRDPATGPMLPGFDPDG